MGKEVRAYLGNLDQTSPYFPFKKERENSIAATLAKHLGMPFNSNPVMSGVYVPTYLVPGSALTRELAAQLLVQTEQDFYGTATPTMNHVGKSILHTTISEKPPAFYSRAFAQEVELQGLVLPGITGFSPIELQDPYEAIGSPYNSYRLKEPDESDGNGQYLIKDGSHLRRIISQLNQEKLQRQGAIIEPNLENKETISAGQFLLGKDRYVFVANQTSGILEGRDIYLGGNNILVARGGFSELISVMKRTHDMRFESVEKADNFLRLYFEYFPGLISSRISVDVLSGTHPDFQYISGVTDITPRLGGLCPATSLAALHLQEHPRQEAVVAQVNLNYTPSVAQPYEKGATIFMNQKPLRITARIDQTI